MTPEFAKIKEDVNGFFILNNSGVQASLQEDLNDRSSHTRGNG